MILPKDSWKTIIKFVAGKNATGTVWADDFMFYGRAGAWAGQDWNTNLEYPTGWYYWLPPNGGNDGVLDNGFENTVVTTEAAHSGSVLAEVRPAVRPSRPRWVRGDEDVYLSKSGSRMSRKAIMLRLTVWLKASNLVPDSAAMYPGTWSVGFTPLWFDKGGNNDGYNPCRGERLHVAVPGGDVVRLDAVHAGCDGAGDGAKVLEVRTARLFPLHRDDLLGRSDGGEAGCSADHGDRRV